MSSIHYENYASPFGTRDNHPHPCVQNTAFSEGHMRFKNLPFSPNLKKNTCCDMFLREMHCINLFRLRCTRVNNLFKALLSNYVRELIRSKHIFSVQFSVCCKQKKTITRKVLMSYIIITESKYNPSIYTLCSF